MGKRGGEMKLRAPIRALPSRWRERYGAEIADMFDQAGRRPTDWLDIVGAGLTARLEESMRHLLIAALTLSTGLSLVLIGYTLGELRDGLVEAPRHWWSALPAVTFAASSAALAWVLLFTRAAIGRNLAD